MSRSKRRPFQVILALLAPLLVVGACASGGAAPLEYIGSSIGRDASGAEVAPMPAATAGPAVADEGNQAVGQRDDALIVRTGSMAVEVADFDAALAKARTAVTGLVGYISGSQMA